MKTIIIEDENLTAKRLESFSQEATEILKIMAASRKTAKPQNR